MERVHVVVVLLILVSVYKLEASSLSARVGEAVTLPCPTEGLDDNNIVRFKWTKSHAKSFIGQRNGTHVKSVESSKYFLNGSVLTIRYTNYSDEDIYHCHVFSNRYGIINNQDHSTLKLKITKRFLTPLLLDMPINHTVKYTSKQTYIVEVKEHDAVNISCKALEGRPQATITWFNNRNEEVIDESTKPTHEHKGLEHLYNSYRTLTLKSVQLHSEGQYTCRAFTPAFNQPQESTVILKIKEKNIQQNNEVMPVLWATVVASEMVAVMLVVVVVSVARIRRFIIQANMVRGREQMSLELISANNGDEKND